MDSGGKGRGVLRGAGVRGARVRGAAARAYLIGRCFVRGGPGSGRAAPAPSSPIVGRCCLPSAAHRIAQKWITLICSHHRLHLSSLAPGPGVDLMSARAHQAASREASSCRPKASVKKLEQQ